MKLVKILVFTAVMFVVTMLAAAVSGPFGLLVCGIIYFSYVFKI